MLEMFLIIISFLAIFGVILYLVLNKLIDVWKDEGVRTRKRALWIWRATLIVILLFVIFLIFINQNIFFGILLSGSGYGTALLIFTIVLFISLIEIVIIDMILPDVVRLWKRIIVETISLVVLVITTVVVFSIYTLTSF